MASISCTIEIRQSLLVASFIDAELKLARFTRSVTRLTVMTKLCAGCCYRNYEHERAIFSVLDNVVVT